MWMALSLHRGYPSTVLQLPERIFPGSLRTGTPWHFFWLHNEKVSAPTVTLFEKSELPNDLSLYSHKASSISCYSSLPCSKTCNWYAGTFFLKSADCDAFLKPKDGRKISYLCREALMDAAPSKEGPYVKVPKIMWWNDSQFGRLLTAIIILISHMPLDFISWLTTELCIVLCHTPFTQWSLHLRGSFVYNVNCQMLNKSYRKTLAVVLYAWWYCNLIHLMQDSGQLPYIWQVQYDSCQVYLYCLYVG